MYREDRYMYREDRYMYREDRYMYREEFCDIVSASPLARCPLVDPDAIEFWYSPSAS